STSRFFGSGSGWTAETKSGESKRKGRTDAKAHEKASSTLPARPACSPAARRMEVGPATRSPVRLVHVPQRARRRGGTCWRVLDWCRATKLVSGNPRGAHGDANDQPAPQSHQLRHEVAPVAENPRLPRRRRSGQVARHALPTRPFRHGLENRRRPLG